MNPYTEIINGNISFRTFSEDTGEEEFVWHRDREDRSITVLEETDWMFQFDNELPMNLSPSTNIFVPRGIYHRIVKGTGDVTVKVTKHETDRYTFRRK